MSRGIRRWIRPEDLVWLALFTTLGLLSPTRITVEFVILAALALLQLTEGRLIPLQSTGALLGAVGGKLLLVYLLMGFTGGIESSYYLLLLLPVVSTATVAGGWATSAVTLVAACSYLSFLLFIDWSRYALPVTQRRELALRLLLLAAVAFLTWTLAQRLRLQAAESTRLAGRLEEANRELAEAESAKRRTDRLAAMGQLAAGLAHELRNPLSTARASAEVLLRTAQGRQAEMAGYIRDEVDRANALISRFLDFARPLEPRFQQVELSDLLTRALGGVATLAAERDIPLVRNESPDIPAISGDPHLLTSVFANLIRNAVEASPPGAAVTIRTRLRDGLAEISVVDRGSGIDQEHREQIFNPFFTTKPEGVGLGLAIVARIVDAHSGSLDVESEPGRGSIFRLTLPVTRP